MSYSIVSNVRIILIISLNTKMSLYALIVTYDLLEDKQKVSMGHFNRRHFVIDFRLF